jgi:flagellar protein FlaF
MYSAAYQDVASETSARIRDNERRAFDHCIELLHAARDAGRGTRQSVEALFFLNRLWGVLLEDLAMPENGLPEELRAKLISIGIWILRYAEEIRLGGQDNFQPLIEISETISAGLRRN